MVQICLDNRGLNHFVDRLRQQKNFSGSIFNGHNTIENLYDVNVRILDSLTSEVKGDLKASDGNFRFENVPVGTYLVQFDKDGFRNQQYRVKISPRTSYGDTLSFHDLFGRVYPESDGSHKISLFVQPADYYGIDSTGVKFNDANLATWPNNGMDRFLEGIVDPNGTNYNANSLITRDIMMGEKTKVYGANSYQLSYMNDWAKVMMGNKTFDDFFEVVSTPLGPPTQPYNYLINDEKTGINWGTDGNNTAEGTIEIYNNEDKNEGRFVYGADINSTYRVGLFHEIGNLYTTSALTSEEGLMNASAKYPNPRDILQLQFYVDFIKAKWKDAKHSGDFGELRVQVPDFEAVNTSNTFVFP